MAFPPTESTEPILASHASKKLDWVQNAILIPRTTTPILGRLVISEREPEAASG